MEKHDPKIEEVRQFLQSAIAVYPDFNQWFDHKVIPGLRSGTRFILTRRLDQKLCGVCILKNENEKKICTLKIHEDYRRIGLARSLCDEAVNNLGTTKPHITMPLDMVPSFSKIIQHYEWVGPYIRIEKDGRKEALFNI